MNIGNINKPQLNENSPLSTKSVKQRAEPALSSDIMSSDRVSLSTKEMEGNLGRNYTKKNNVESASYLLNQISSQYPGKDAKLKVDDIEIYVSEPPLLNNICHYLVSLSRKIFK
ncbi:MAG: hypothetical protein MUO63_03270 [Desulfobulbaceae bacterium]|nr:hypothetical protein [Desulfobulbaceae bacterium]